MSDPAILLADETVRRGWMPGARFDIYSILRDAATKGTGRLS